MSTAAAIADECLTDLTSSQSPRGSTARCKSADSHARELTLEYHGSQTHGNSERNASPFPNDLKHSSDDEEDCDRATDAATGVRTSMKSIRTKPSSAMDDPFDLEALVDHTPEDSARKVMHSTLFGDDSGGEDEDADGGDLVPESVMWLRSVLDRVRLSPLPFATAMCDEDDNMDLDEDGSEMELDAEEPPPQLQEILRCSLPLSLLDRYPGSSPSTSLGDELAGALGRSNQQQSSAVATSSSSSIKPVNNSSTVAIVKPVIRAAPVYPNDCPTVPSLPIREEPLDRRKLAMVQPIPKVPQPPAMEQSICASVADSPPPALLPQSPQSSGSRPRGAKRCRADIEELGEGRSFVPLKKERRTPSPERIKTPTFDLDFLDNFAPDKPAHIDIPFDRSDAARDFVARAKDVKHHADDVPNHKDNTDRKTSWILLYMESIVYFALTVIALEEQHRRGQRGGGAASSSTTLRQTIEMANEVAPKFYKTVRESPLLSRIHVLCLRMQSLLCRQMFELKQTQAMNNYQAITEYTRTQARLSPSKPSSNPPSTKSGSTPSPTPSPASSTGSHASGSLPPGYTAVPNAIDKTLNQQVHHLHNLLWAHEYWKKADYIQLTDTDKSFFGHLDRLCGQLTLTSQIKHLCVYVLTATEWLRQIHEHAITGTN